ncbi:MAG: glycosyltransferase, partial [Oscillospiraceae bacterium]|nr:glycosyltransferase [Oscillospiraceae bacterium]
RFRPACPEEKASLRRTLNLPDGILILYAAEFSGRKNHKPLLKAMRQMAARRPEVTLLLAGDGKRLEASRRLAHRLGVAGRVRFLGYVPDTAPLLRACDGALSVSLSEGMPAGVMEAMACGLPLAASRIKGHTDLLSGRPAFLFDPRKPAGIADGIAALAGEARTPRRGQSGVRLPDKEEAAELFLRRLRETVPSGL